MENNLGNKQVMAENLKTYMSSYGITATRLSDDLDIPVTTISNWLRGVAYPRIDKIELLASYFHCSKADLVEPNIKDYIEPVSGPYAGKHIMLDNFSEKLTQSVSFLKDNGYAVVEDKTTQSVDKNIDTSSKLAPAEKEELIRLLAKLDVQQLQRVRNYINMLIDLKQ